MEKTNGLNEMLALEKQGLTRQEIADKLGKTRNMVCGALGRHKKPKKSVTKVVKPPKPPKLCNPKAVYVRLVHPPTKTQKTILQLKSTDCRFILDNGMYCGGLVYKRSFCKACYDVCYQPMKVRNAK